MVEPLQHIVNDVYQPYITTIHQSIKSRRSKFKITRTLKPNNIAVAYIAIGSHFTSNVYNKFVKQNFPMCFNQRVKDAFDSSDLPLPGSNHVTCC